MRDGVPDLVDAELACFCLAYARSVGQLGSQALQTIRVIAEITEKHVGRDDGRTQR